MARTIGKFKNEDIIDEFSIMSFESFENSIQISLEVEGVCDGILHHRKQSTPESDEYIFFVRWSAVEDKEIQLKWVPAAVVTVSEIIKYFLKKLNRIEQK